MYAVVALFDEQSEQAIKTFWHRLAWKGLLTQAQVRQTIRPYLTFATYDKLPLNRIPIYIQTFCQMTKPLSITFQALGSFPPESKLFLTPTVTKELLHMHTTYHAICDSFQNTAHSLYLPGQWIPHCTLATYLTIEELTAAFASCSQSFTPIETTIQSIGIVHIQEENNRYAEHQLVIDIPLQSGFVRI
jgi:2'-5' RNA ligase